MGDYEFHSDCRVIPLNQLRNKALASISFERVKQIIPGLSEMLLSPGGNWILLHEENQNWILKDVKTWKTIQEFDISWQPVMSESAFQEEANTWHLALKRLEKP
jgi:predicted KAP-like P-loop ATPase